MLHIATPVQASRCGVYVIVIPDPSWEKPIFYIGMTTRSFVERLREHRRLLEAGEHNNDVLQRAWNDGRPMVVGELIGFPLEHHDRPWVDAYIARAERTLIAYAQQQGYTVANEVGKQAPARPSKRVPKRMR